MNIADMVAAVEQIGRVTGLPTDPKHWHWTGDRDPGCFTNTAKARERLGLGWKGCGGYEVTCYIGDEEFNFWIDVIYDEPRHFEKHANGRRFYLNDYAFFDVFDVAGRPINWKNIRELP